MTHPCLPTTTTMTKPWQTATPALSLLGGLRLHRAGPALGVGSAGLSENRFHVRAVMALVGSSPEGFGRDELVDLLWPGATTAAGRNRLYHTVHLARQAFAAIAGDGDWIAVRQSRVVLDDAVWCDVHVLERDGNRVDERSSDAELTSLLSLCHGQWMPDLNLGSVCETIRARVRRTQSHVLRECVRRLLPLGDGPALRARLNDLLRLEPTDEVSHQELMRLDLSAGRPHAVLRAYDRVSRELATQLGLKPAAATRALAADAAATLSSARCELMQQPGAPIVGRKPLIDDVLNQMLAGRGVWNLFGLSGVGKTTVAREVARRLAPALLARSAWVPLGDMDPSDTASAACLRALSIPPRGNRAWHQLLAEAVRERPVILVFDDLDVCSDGQALLTAFADMEQIRVLATSRLPLSVAGTAQPSAPNAWLHHVQLLPLAVPDEGASALAAQHSPSVMLFEARCGFTAEGRKDPEWFRDVAKLVRRLDGMPLAIELAAARAAAIGPAEIADQLQRGLESLASGPLDLESRHRSITRALDWSAQHLSDEARKLYCAAAVFPGDFERAELTDLISAVAVAPDAAESALLELLLAGLLSPVAGADSRVRMLHLPREHARGTARTRGVWLAVQSARVEQLCRAVAEHPIDLESPTSAAGFGWLQQREEDLTAVLEHARQHQPSCFLILCEALCDYWRQDGGIGLTAHWAPLAVNCALALGQPATAAIHLAFLSMDFRRRGLADRALATTTQAMLLCADVDDSIVRMRVLGYHTVCLASQGRLHEALALLKQHEATVSLRPGQSGYWLFKLACSEIRRDIVLQDVLPHRAALQGSVTWPRLLLQALRQRSAVEDSQTLLPIAQEVVDLTRSPGLRALLGSALHARAGCELGSDRLDEALRTYREYLDLCLEAGEPRTIAVARCMLFLAHFRYGQMEAALAILGDLRVLKEPVRGEFGTLRMPLAYATYLAIVADLQTTLEQLKALPSEWIERTDDDSLIAWAELCALVAKRLGWECELTGFVNDMRTLDMTDEFIPSVRRFRDQHFGAGPELTSWAAHSAVQVRDRLRVQTVALHLRIQNHVLMAD